MLKKFLAICIILVMSLSCISCGKKIDSPEEVVTNYLNAIKSKDFETAKTYVMEENDQVLSEMEEEELANEMIRIFETLSFQVVSTKVNDSTATVKTTIKNIDMKPVMGDVISELFSLAFSDLDEATLEAKQSEAFVNALEANKDTTIETEVEIQLEKGETGWLIIPNEKLADGITGGLLSIGEDLANSFGKESENEVSN
ncbi:hypothetical protein [Anaerotignum sp. MB30-C6]|uniref:hypothetical protein n=1 Tax=Anaerotignum sp. MB30-C6 TaxID=3070814 RepID=UPI0027DB5A98|nr:hypothetical protein [Anaerotignum sp. MB30-C6]WMI81792.1 hypothetical protein RBQ60_03435 [Anaerotignum sp. MB30-C6]